MVTDREAAHTEHFGDQHPDLDPDRYGVGSCPGGCVIDRRRYPKLSAVLDDMPRSDRPFTLPPIEPAP